MAHAYDESRPFVQLMGVSKAFAAGEQRVTVLDQASLEINAGESVALRGRSGSGKSTLLNIIAGIESADGGEVIVDGRDIGQLDETARTLFRRAHIGFVYQSFNLLTGLCVADNIALVLELNGWSRERTRKRTTALLRAVDMTDRAQHFPDVLSGGEQQRIAIARAVAHEPRLILADEPTGNLDDDNAQAVLPLLLDLVSDNNATLLMATHSRRIADTCKRSLSVVGGKLA